MRTEVHVHGSIVLVEGVTAGQVEGALRPWLDYLDVASMKEARSLEQDEPGIVFDRKRYVLEVCWTGDVGRNFQGVLGDALAALGPLYLGQYHRRGIFAWRWNRPDAPRPV